MNITWIESAVIAIVVFVILMAIDRVPALAKLPRNSKAIAAAVLAAASVLVLGLVM